MRTNRDRSVWIVGASTVAVGIGSVMPWVTTHWTVGHVSVAGTDGDGRITIVAATAAIIAVAVAAKTRTKHQLLPVLGLIAGAIVEATAVYNTVTIHETVGAGLWIVDIAAALLIAGALFALQETSTRQAMADFEALLPRPTGDMVVSRTVVVTMPMQRESTDVPQQQGEA